MPKTWRCAVYFPQPADLPDLFVRAWNERRAEKIAGLFAEDAEFINVVGLWWRDRQAIFKAHEYGLRKIFRDSTLEIRQKKVRQLSDEVAIVYARMRLSGQTPHAGVETPGVRFNVFTFVVRREKKAGSAFRPTIPTRRRARRPTLFFRTAASMR